MFFSFLTYIYDTFSCQLEKTGYAGVGKRHKNCCIYFTYKPTPEKGELKRFSQRGLQ